MLALGAGHVSVSGEVFERCLVVTTRAQWRRRPAFDVADHQLKLIEGTLKVEVRLNGAVLREIVGLVT